MNRLTSESITLGLMRIFEVKLFLISLSRILVEQIVKCDQMTKIIIAFVGD